MILIKKNSILIFCSLCDSKVTTTYPCVLAVNRPALILMTLTQIQAWEQEKDKERLTTKGAINLIPHEMEKPASQKPSC